MLLSLIREYAASKSILGVCRGHQAIGEAFGGQLVNLSTVFHGVATPVKVLRQEGLFEGMDRGLEVGRYHSWVISEEGFPDVLAVTARDDNDYILGLPHKTLDVQW